MKAVLLLALVLMMSELVLSKDCKRRRRYKGCKLSSGDCVCGKVKQCHNPYPYETEQECWDDVKGVGDKCLNNPCHHGTCVQLKRRGDRRWYCECAGTGYHGHRCKHKCPARIMDTLPEDFPTACIMVEREMLENTV